jgi:DNA-directed RNA polymerase specialized sigma24 family protein
VTADACDDRTAPIDAAMPAQANHRPVDPVRLAEAWQQLQPLSRAVIGRARRGWATDRIAADLDVADAVVKIQLHRALHALRQLLADPTSPC